MKRRDMLQMGSLVLLLGVAEIARGATILAVRVWPAPDYSRVTIESDAPLKTTQLFVGNPPRLAVDIDGIELNAALKELVAKVQSDDPTIAGIRVGQFAPGVVRLVLDLKQTAKPQIFTLLPVAAYQHRLVLDMYPSVVADPLEALIAERFGAPQAATPRDPAGVREPAAPGAVGDPLGELIAQHAAGGAAGSAVGGSVGGAVVKAPAGPAKPTAPAVASTAP
ncbi:MAG TPA: AMIN domain-containing protein, partial [Burkholderiaceae bacterium]|nr:AMIN domain-containing protein [Burkholderiaceae bacterium]